MQGSVKAGTAVVREGFNPYGTFYRHEGVVLDILDKRAWRIHLRKWRHVRTWSDGGGSDVSWGYSIPENADEIKHALRSLIMKGELNPNTTVPVLWNFNGSSKVYWEPIEDLKVEE